MGRGRKARVAIAVVALALFGAGCIRPGPPPPPPPPPPPGELGLPAYSGNGARVVYRNSTQQVWVVDANNHVVDTYPVSGRSGVPAPGTYRVYQKQISGRDNTSTLALPFFIVFTGDIGFHAIPVDAFGRPVQSDAQLGQPLSHGCVRLRRDKAEFLWNWTVIGTPVVVLA